MEAATTPSAPAAADPAQLPAQPAPGQQTPQAPVQPATVPEQLEPEGDVRSQLKAMEDRVKALEGPESQQEAGQDLLAALSPEETEELGFTPEEIAQLQAGQAPGQQVEQPQEQQAQLEALDNYMEQRIREAVDPLRQERQQEQITAFVKEHPDIQTKEVMDPVVATMENFVGRYGEGARWDVGLLELAYTSVKAKQADANAVPAEQAANHGASIETQAGQTQVGETSAEDLYRQRVFGGSQGGGEAFR